MACLGPRKKEKKSNTFLSPDDAELGSRSVKSGKVKSTKTSPSLLGGKTKTKSPVPSVASRKSSTATISRPSADASAKDLKNSPSRNSLVANGRRSPSPAGPRSRSPATRPTSGLSTGTRTPSATHSSGHSRNGSVASVRKSPVAQMREEFDELKLKNNENIELIAQQKAELEMLKRQLAEKAAEKEAEAKALPPLSTSESHSELDALQQQNQEAIHRLQEKEEELRKREEEIMQLRQKLEQDKNVPSIVVSQDEQAEAADELAERERMLAEKERLLEEQRRKWQEEQNEAQAQAKQMEDAAAQQLERLRQENELAAQRLAEKEKELEALRLQIQDHPQTADGSHPVDSETLDKIKELNDQLEAEKWAHEQSLRRHEEALAEKEKLLAEQQKALDALHESHEDEIRRLKTEQSSSILALKQRHKQAMAEIQERLTAAENNPNRNAAVNMDDEIERILREFEQTEHTHAVQIENLQQAHESQLSDLQENHVAQVQKLRKNLNQSNKKWTERFLPVEAVSWPAPQPISALRKTSGPAPRPKKMMTAEDDMSPILQPLDNKKVQVYISTVSGNTVIKDNQEKLLKLLDANGVTYETVDVAASEAALQYMKRCNNNGSTTGRAKPVPQLFVGGEYRGQYEDVVQSIEDGTLDTLLTPAPERILTAEEKAAIAKAEATKAALSNDPANAPPVRVLPAGPVSRPTLRKANSPGAVRPYRGEEDDDEALFKELEKEIEQGKLDDSKLLDL